MGAVVVLLGGRQVTISFADLQQFRIVDCDTHIIEPYDLWTSRVPAKWIDDVPKVVWDEERKQDVWTMPGRHPMAAAAGSAMAGWKEYPPNRPPTLADADPATWDVKQRLQKMDEQGIHAQVLYPNIGGFGGGTFTYIKDVGLRLACVRAYNDWLIEWSSAAPERFVANCAVPFWDIDDSVEEIRRCRDIGHRGILFSSHPDRFGQPHLADPTWDPIWATAEELQLPVNFHIGGGGVGDFGALYDGNNASINYAVNSSLIYMSNAAAIVNTIFAGIPERFPELKFVSVESGIGWVPFTLESMDWMWLATGLDKMYPERLMPSEYFKRSYYACFWFERAGVRSALEALGDDRVLFETDFPHPTAQVPGPASPGVSTPQYINEVLADLPTSTLQKIFHDNATSLYGLDR
jgi:predicted TIM-barrel fold metal-dependent hydrolase